MAGPITFVVITGMSGAGKSYAIKCFEDMGFFCVDNLPTTLIPTFADLVARSKHTDRPRGARRRRARGRVPHAPARHAGRAARARPRRRGAVPGGERGGAGAPLPGDAPPAPAGARRQRAGRHPRRAQGALHHARGRRPHRRHRPRSPCTSSRTCSSSTTSRPGGGRACPSRWCRSGSSTGSRSTPTSSSTSASCPTRTSWRDCGRSTDATRGCGTSSSRHEESRELLRRLEDFLGFVLPAYQREGKAYLTVAIGCTGGRHRSVALVEELRGFLDRLGLAASVVHRDLDRE